MNVLLMHRDRDFDLEQASPAHEPALTQDLELDTLFGAMAGGDRFLFQVVRKAVLLSLTDLEAIRYRQDVLRDCLDHAAVVREIYQISVQAEENKKRRRLGIFGRSPGGILAGAIDVLQMYVELLERLSRIAGEHAGHFKSEGFRRFFAMIQQELNDTYFDAVQEHLDALRFRDGVLLSIELGQGNEGIHHLLRKPNQDRNWIERVLTPSPEYSFRIHPRDEHGARALGELKDRGINLVANALAQSADHIDGFFKALRIELAFYVGCLNLCEQLTQIGEPVTFPVPAAAGEPKFTVAGLYDVCLALTMRRQVVGNDVHADGKDLVIITGANQGGKSTFLRSVGLARLMMQAGMVVPAEAFCAAVCSGLYTHFRRKEDATMTSGKLDEELGRMSDIADRLVPDAIVLFNESFAATNEREGSEIARQIVSVLLDKGIQVFFVTHLYEFARGFYAAKRANVLFLRAERQPNGKRTYKLIEGQPLQTSYGQDLYRQTFGADDRRAIPEGTEPAAADAGDAAGVDGEQSRAGRWAQARLSRDAVPLGTLED